MTHEINIADFAAFCRSKGEETFDYGDICGCALAQYGKHRFPNAPFIHGGNSFFHVGEPGGDFEEVGVAGLDEDAVYEACGSFSALADRLEALLETADA